MNVPGGPTGEQAWEGLRGGGGTSGGLGSFILGGVLAVAGGYLILNQVQVQGGYWRWWGPNTFGLTLIPLSTARASFGPIPLTLLTSRRKRSRSAAVMNP